MSKNNDEARIITATQEEVHKYGSAAEGPADPAAEQKAEADSAQAPAENAELVELKDKLARARADLANFQRRAVKERDQAVRFAVADFARELLDVVDDFERTREAAESSDSAKGIVEGAKLIYEKLLKILSDHHVERIEAVGQPFDPAVHQAVTQQPSKEHPSQTVLQEVQKGYRLHDRLLRPTKVIVSCKPDPDRKSDKKDGKKPGHRQQENRKKSAEPD